MVQCVHCEVQLSVEYVIEEPLVVVREVVIEVDVHLIWHLDHLVVSGGIDIAGHKVIVKGSLHANVLHSSFDESLKTLAYASGLSHVVLKVKIT